MGKVSKIFRVPSIFTVTAFGYGENSGWMVEFETCDGHKQYMTMNEFYQECNDVVWCGLLGEFLDTLEGMKNEE